VSGDQAADLRLHRVPNSVEGSHHASRCFISSGILLCILTVVLEEMSLSPLRSSAMALLAPVLTLHISISHLMNMHRRGGLAALDRIQQTKRGFDSLSNEILKGQVDALHTQLAQFRAALQGFAREHRDAIRDDPQLRRAFAQMCASIGVDPLAGPRRGGWWSELLGVGDWTHELGVQIVDVCVSTRSRNGGLLPISELTRLLRVLRGVEPAQLAEEDVITAIGALKALGAGYEVVDVGGTRMVRSVVKELDTDQAVILALAQETGGRVVESILVDRKAWTRERAHNALENMLVRDGLCMVDDQDEECGRAYWVLSAMRFED
jgi:ESCRT-II complex subunit VPS22